MMMNEEYVPTKDLSLPIVVKVRQKVRRWLNNYTELGGFRSAIKGFAFCVRNYPDHPAFDLLEREGGNITHDEISKVLSELSKDCRWDFYRKGCGLVVYVKGMKSIIYDPIRLVVGKKSKLNTAFSKLTRHRIKEIGVKVLEEGKKHLIDTRLMDMEDMCKLEYQVQHYKNKFKIFDCSE